MFSRIMVIVILCALGFDSAAVAEEPLNLAGVGMIVATSPYDGVKTKATGMPFLLGEYKNFYIRGIEAGYHFFKNENVTLSALMSPRFMGYSSEDSAALGGMEDRRRSWDAGLKADLPLPWSHAVLSGKVLADVLSRSDGMDYELALRRPVKGEFFLFVPSVGVRYQSKSMVDYYYGVRTEEVRVDRPAYAPGGAVNPFAHMTLTTGLSRKIIIVTMIGVESLGREIRKSPVVDKSCLLTAVAGLTYRF